MKIIYTFLMTLCCTQLAAEVATFSTDDNTLNVPLLVINGSVYYQDVTINLNSKTGEFSILSASKTDAASVGAQSVTLSSATPALLFTNDTLTLLDIQDSRCPQDAQCIVAGEIIIGLQLQDHVSNTITLMELTLEGNGDMPGSSVKTEDYSFRLLDASPYPTLADTIAEEDYRFKIEYSLNLD
ncbi:MAG: hypothetical protein P8J44_05880 [Gammaproteobacteria bacterium]|nr:hypothetical protein [Gammaproteobacteria bacterium]